MAAVNVGVEDVCFNDMVELNSVTSGQCMYSDGYTSVHSTESAFITNVIKYGNRDTVKQVHTSQLLLSANVIDGTADDQQCETVDGNTRTNDEDEYTLARVCSPQATSHCTLALTKDSAHIENVIEDRKDETMVENEEITGKDEYTLARICTLQTHTIGEDKNTLGEVCTFQAHFTPCMHITYSQRKNINNVIDSSEEDQQYETIDGNTGTTDEDEYNLVHVGAEEDSYATINENIIIISNTDIDTDDYTPSRICEVRAHTSNTCTRNECTIGFMIILSLLVIAGAASLAVILTKKSQDINECASGPCKNNGLCAYQVNGYICVCQKSYTGTNCEININECASMPCRNSGICADKVNGYTCHCQTGYTGTNCEIDKNECASMPCRNSGICADKVNGYTCHCQKGYTGTNCEIDINECASRPCRNSGICADKVNGYTCTCPKGFTGINCETDINECASRPCRNSGICADKVNGYTCTCQKGFTGINCETACHLVNLKGGVKHGSSCYFFSNTKDSLNVSITRCNSLGGYLVEIEDSAENSFLEEIIKSKPFYEYFIGLNDLKQDGTYSWFGSNRLLSQTGYSRWADYEPNNYGGDEDCVVMRQTGLWNDLPCNYSYPYICEINY